jgi:putative pyoverdin transport system ATP-binding/permease protein
MSFFELIRREMQGSLTRLLVMSGIGGVSNAAILSAVNSGAQAVGDNKPSLWGAALFVVSLLLFIKSQHYILISSTTEIEAIIHKLRVRLMDQVRRSELIPLDAIGRAGIVAGITRETATLTQATNMIAFAAQSVVLIFFVAIYVAYLSLLAFALTVIVVSMAALLLHLKSRDLTAGMRAAAEWDHRLFDRLTDLLDGFKEVRLNRARSDDLFDDIVEVSRTAANIKIRTQSEMFKRLVFSQSSIYVLLGAIVFVAPVLADTQAATIAKATTATLFVVGACFGLVQSIPILTAANAAADNIERLEARLQGTTSEASVGPAQPQNHFEEIEMQAVRFSYFDKLSEATFQVGPIDFKLRRGELVFITGGNGSGKSTFMRLLAGLYHPDSGEITFDGKRVTDRTRDAYRSLFAAIFVDYHLFRRLYGIGDADPDDVEELLMLFRLADKTRLVDNEFTAIDLSGGQRRRLALIVSLLEKRPILLLDEWTAEQDPEFRRKFYDELLPQLMRDGATIVAITHDDRYLEELDLPARRLRMDEGRFIA